MSAQKGLLAAPKFYKWFYIIAMRVITCPLAFGMGGVCFQIGYESEPISYEFLAYSALCFFAVYIFWFPMGRLYMTIPYRQELVSRALELMVPLGNLQKQGYLIGKTKRQIEEAESERQRQAEREKRDAESRRKSAARAAQKAKERKKLDRERVASQKAKEKENRRIAVEALLAEYPQTPQDIAETCMKEKICIGMPEAFVTLVLGKSFENKKEVTKKGTRVTCKYKPAGKNRLGNMTYEFEVKYLNGVVDGFKEL